MQHLITQIPILNKQHAAWFIYKTLPPVYFVCCLSVWFMLFRFMCNKFSVISVSDCNLAREWYNWKHVRTSGHQTPYSRRLKQLWNEKLIRPMAKRQRHFLFLDYIHNLSQSKQPTNKASVVSGDQGLALLTGNMFRWHLTGQWFVPCSLWHWSLY